MTDAEYMQQTQKRVEQLRGEQMRLFDNLATDMRRIAGMRMGLTILSGALALGAGLGLGYQIGRR